MFTGEMTAFCHRSTGKLCSLVTQFFEMVPVRRMHWQNADITINELDIDGQRFILSSTVNSELCQLFPPSIHYQKAFVKKLLNTLEGCDVEVCDELYETYTRLLQHVESEDDILCYKTYTLDDAVQVTLRESVNMISCGTTGLSTWQAAQHLVEWAVQNKELLENRNVIELGCGLGLTGISLCRLCHLDSYTFTDCHTQVLDGLIHNIELNFSEIPHTATGTQYTDKVYKNNPSAETSDCVKEIYEHNSHRSCDRSCDDGDKSHTDCDNGSSDSKSDCVTNNLLVDCDTVASAIDCDTYVDKESCLDPTSKHLENCNESVDLKMNIRKFQINKPSCCKSILAMCLDWENINHDLMKQLEHIDLVLAADVVYDTSIIPALVSILKVILGNREAKPVAYIASTIRNEDTRDQFLVTLSTEGLKYESVDPPSVPMFHYDRSLPIEIIRITAPV